MEPVKFILYRQYNWHEDKTLYSFVGVDKNGVEYREQFSNKCSAEKLGAKLKELIKHLEE